MAGQTKSIIITVKAKQSDHTKNDKNGNRHPMFWETTTNWRAP